MQGIYEVEFDEPLSIIETYGKHNGRQMSSPL